jgi:pyruvyltransferase
MKLFWHKTQNFGDAIAPIILGHFCNEPVEFAGQHEKGKWVSTGSIMYAVRDGDIVWGTGLIEPNIGTAVAPAKAKYLAVRGPLTKEQCGIEVETFGDPGMLLPRVYNPDVKKTHAIGYMPHYVDQKIVLKTMAFGGPVKFIDIRSDWKKVVEEMKSCEMIVTSSLHGIICSDAYGIPVRWEKYSDNVIGGEFKFQDYLLGTGRERHKYGDKITPIKNLKERQDALITALQKHYGKK